MSDTAPFHVVLLKQEGKPPEVLRTLHETESLAERQGRAWEEHTKGLLRAETVLIQVPLIGRRVSQDPPPPTEFEKQVAAVKQATVEEATDARLF